MGDHAKRKPKMTAKYMSWRGLRMLTASREKLQKQTSVADKKNKTKGDRLVDQRFK